jgi:hypothetical protein
MDLLFMPQKIFFFFFLIIQRVSAKDALVAS